MSEPLKENKLSKEILLVVWAYSPTSRLFNSLNKSKTKTMKHISFELTMPNVGSWNGKWTGADQKYYIIKKVSVRLFKSRIEQLFKDQPKMSRGFYYNFGDGWGANVRMELIDAIEGRKRQKLSKGFAGYDWMVASIIEHGKIIVETFKIES